MSWYKTGSVSVAQNSNAVIGTGTAFIANGRVGDAFQGPDGDWYEVTNIASDTAMSIAPNYKSATNTAGPYALAPMQGYNKDTADALREASSQVGGALDGLEESVTAAASSAAAALVSMNAAATSEANAGNSAAAALTSKNAAGLSETHSADSAAAALASKNAAATSEANAGNSAAAALTSKNAAAISEANAAASATAAAGLGVGAGYIEGLIPKWISATSISLSSGAAYMPAAGKVMVVASDLTLSGLTLTAATWYYLYLYDNAGVAAIELSDVAPADPYNGTARTKTGNNTRRFITAIRAQVANVIRKFLWAEDYVNYTDVATLYLSMNGVTSAGPVPFSASSFIPPVTQRYLFQVYGPGSGGSLFMGDVPPNQQISCNAGVRFMGASFCSPTQGLYYGHSGAVTGGSSFDIRGYGSER
jgi:hypothetical protein